MENGIANSLYPAPIPGFQLQTSEAETCNHSQNVYTCTENLYVVWGKHILNHLSVNFYQPPSFKGNTGNWFKALAHPKVIILR